MLPDFGKRFGVVYADPPWSFTTWSDNGKDRAPDKHYPVMDAADLAMMAPDIDRVATKDAALLMWVTSPMLMTGIGLMRHWGFTYKSIAFVWVKINKDGTPFKGLGYWTRANAELCLLGTRGKPQRQAKDVGQVLLAPRGRHSAKPEAVRSEIARLLPGPYLELFARDRAVGWSSWGNELVEDTP